MVAFLALVALSPEVQAQSNTLQQGLDFFQHAQYEQALQQFVEARRLNPHNASIENFIGITETKLGRLEDAKRDFEAASRIDPKLAGPHTNLGYNYLSDKQYDAAEKELRTALSLDSNDPFTHYYLAVLYLTTSRGAEAIPHIEPGISLLKEDVPAALLAIEACLESNALPEARKLLTLEESQFSTEQEFAIASALNKRSLYEDAAEQFQRIAAREPSWQNQANLARAYESAGKNDLALAAWQKAITGDPGNPDLYLDCTRLLIDMERYPEATEIVERGVPLVPDGYPLTIRLGAIAMLGGQHEKARDIYQKAILAHPSLALGYVAVAQSYMKDGKDEDALKVLTTARTMVPQDFALEYVYGLVSFQLGDYDQAAKAFTTAEHMQPEVVEPHFQLGLLSMKKQEWKEAGNEFEQALKLDPQNAATYYQLSRTYQRLGENEKAQEMAKQAGLLTKSQHEEGSKSRQLQFGLPGSN